MFCFLLFFFPVSTWGFQPFGFRPGLSAAHLPTHREDWTVAGNQPPAAEADLQPAEKQQDDKDQRGVGLISSFGIMLIRVVFEAVVLPVRKVYLITSPYPVVITVTSNQFNYINRWISKISEFELPMQAFMIQQWCKTITKVSVSLYNLFPSFSFFLGPGLKSSNT